MAQSIQYDLRVIQDEVRDLLNRGLISYHQPIYVLSQYIPVREWAAVELELEERNFLLNERIIELIGHEQWHND